MPFLILALSFYLFVGTAMPIYIDEILWKAIQARVGIDSGVTTGLWAMCESFQTKVPFFHKVYFALNEFIYGHSYSPQQIRYFGIFFGLLWLVQVLLLLDKKARPVFFLFIGTGIFPVTIIMNRPETILLNAITFLILVAYLEIGRNRTVVGPAFWAFIKFRLARLFLAGFAFYLTMVAHPKGLLLLPLIIAVVFLFKDRMDRIILSIFTALLAWESLVFNLQRTSCANIPEFHLAWKYSGGVLMPQLIFTEPIEFLRKFFAMAVDFSEYFFMNLQDAGAKTGWLPIPTEGTFLMSTVNSLSLLLFWISICTYGLALVAMLIPFTKWKCSKKLQISYEVKILVLGILTSLFVLSAFFINKTGYQGIIFIGLWYLGACLILQELLRPLVLPKKYFMGLAIGFFAVGAINFFCLSESLVPYANKRMQGGLSNWNISMHRFEEHKQEIFKAATSCGFDLSSIQSHFLVDEIVFMVLGDHLQNPVFTDFVATPASQRRDILGLLHKLGSAGGVFTCSPDSFFERNSLVTQRVGNYCCLSVKQAEVEK